MWRWYFLDDEKWEKAKAEILSWLGTPYMHMAGVKGRGADCNQFIGTALTIMGLLEYGYSYDYYSNDWYEHTDREIILEYVRKHRESLRDELDYLEMEYTPELELMRGDYLGFSIFTDFNVVNHSGIYLGDGTFINSAERRGVIIYPLDGYWKRHLKKVIRVFEVV